MSHQRPRDIALLELRDGDFPREGSIGFIEDVLGRDLDSLAEMFADE